MAQLGRPFESVHCVEDLGSTVPDSLLIHRLHDFSETDTVI